MTDFIGALIFAGAGLLVGSFVNVLIYRLPLMILTPSTHPQAHALNLAWPSSHCPHCQHPIAWYHNLPVLSFAYLRGRCAHCQQRIAWRYPLTEIIVAFIGWSCAWHWGVTVNAVVWALFLTILYALSVIDWQTTLLPDTLTGALLWMGLLSASLGLLPISASQSILGAVAGYASLWLLASSFTWITHKEGMGGGDFKLLGGIGAWLGWSLLPWVAFGASVLGLLIAVVLMGLGRMKRTDYLPFGPMLSMIAALVAWVGSDTLLDLTLGLLGR